jgi:hypothetical protein
VPAKLTCVGFLLPLEFDRPYDASRACISTSMNGAAESLRRENRGLKAEFYNHGDWTAAQVVLKPNPVESQDSSFATLGFITSTQITIPLEPLNALCSLHVRRSDRRQSRLLGYRRRWSGAPAPDRMQVSGG